MPGRFGVTTRQSHAMHWMENKRVPLHRQSTPKNSSECQWPRPPRQEGLIRTPLLVWSCQYDRTIRCAQRHPILHRAHAPNPGVTERSGLPPPRKRRPRKANAYDSTLLVAESIALDPPPRLQAGHPLSGPSLARNSRPNDSVAAVILIQESTIPLELNCELGSAVRWHRVQPPTEVNYVTIRQILLSDCSPASMPVEKLFQVFSRYLRGSKGPPLPILRVGPHTENFSQNRIFLARSTRRKREEN